MTQAKRNRVMLGTAGHIDHGKSSLVRALTGVDPDRLAEEKRRGITIELGFAELTLLNNTTLSVVDVPGHERFVRQMIAGSTGIDIALLCIAADDLVMPQTVEHLSVLEILGVSTCVVALTKADLVDAEWLEFAQGEIRLFLEDTPYAHAAIVPVSSRSGFGMDELRKALTDAASKTTRIKRGAAMRLPIDRVFTIKGAGTVVTGTLWSGSVSTGDELEILPSGVLTRVRSVQVHDRDIEAAETGMRTALNLSALKKSDIQPGDFLATPRTSSTTDHFDAWLSYLDTSQGAKPLASGCRVHVAHGTREVIGRILLMDGQESLAPQKSAYAQVRLDEPLPVAWGDRFVIRSYSPVRVIGGGTVLAAHPRRRTTLSTDARTLLDALRIGDEDAAVSAVLSMQKLPISAAQIAKAAGISEEMVAPCLKKMKDTGSITTVGVSQPTFFATRSVASRSLAAIDNALLRWHTENPLLPGIAKGALAQRCFKRIDPTCLDALLEEATHGKRIMITDGMISHPQAGGGAKQAAEQAATKIAAILTATCTTPPTTTELIAQANVDASLAFRALGTLEKQGRIVRISAEFCFDTPAFEKLKQATIQALNEHSSASASELKEAMGTTRKYAMPLLEYLDTQGVTLRDGDMRSLRR